MLGVLSCRGGSLLMCDPEIEDEASRCCDFSDRNSAQTPSHLPYESLRMVLLEKIAVLSGGMLDSCHNDAVLCVFAGLNYLLLC